MYQKTAIEAMIATATRMRKMDPTVAFVEVFLAVFAASATPHRHNPHYQTPLSASQVKSHSSSVAFCKASPAARRMTRDFLVAAAALDHVVHFLVAIDLQTRISVVFRGCRFRLLPSFELWLLRWRWHSHSFSSQARLQNSPDNSPEHDSDSHGQSTSSPPPSAA